MSLMMLRPLLVILLLQRLLDCCGVAATGFQVSVKFCWIFLADPIEILLNNTLLKVSYQLTTTNVINFDFFFVDFFFNLNHKFSQNLKQASEKLCQLYCTKIDILLEGMTHAE